MWIEKKIEEECLYDCQRRCLGWRGQSQQWCLGEVVGVVDGNGKVVQNSGAVLDGARGMRKLRLIEF